MSVDNTKPTTSGQIPDLQKAPPHEEVARISVKIPPFWHARPELWFAQVESQFVTAGITVEQTKYHTIVATIDGAILSQVSDMILNMPKENPYSTLKKRMLDEFF